MKTTSTRYTGLFVSRRHLLFVPVILIALAVLATVSFLPSASASNPFGKALNGKNSHTAPAVPGKTNSSFTPRIERRPFAFLLPSLAESIETFASDCTTPKTAFSLGETVCAKTDGVNLTETRFVNWILLGSPNTVVYGGEGVTDITTNPQTFTYIPTDQGSYKVSIAIPGDISQTPAVFTVGPPASTVISTYAADCTTPKISFSLGETVCAKVNGEPLGASDPIRSINWQERSGLIVHTTAITTDPQTDTFALPANATTMIGGLVVDNRGTWRITSNATEDASVRQETYISVHDPAATVADLWIEQATNNANAEVEEGSTTTFDLFVSNKGPDAAQNVVVTDTIPSNTTFVSIVETSGLGFNCAPPSGGVVTCTLPSLPPGSLAKFTLALQVNAGSGAGAVIANSASVTSATTDLDTSDNSSDGSAVVPSPPPAQTCTITCRENLTLTADTTQGGNPGKFVTFTSTDVIAGSCGAITPSPASGSFFPLGTTVVNVTSATGGGSCSFTITIVQTPPPSITCPANINVTAALGENTANVNPGTPTTSPSSGVTVTGIRSDDDDDPLTAPKPLSDPYPVGVTGIEWTVADPSGNKATCQQTITVNAADRTQLTISCPINKTVAAPAGSCEATVNPGTPTTNPSDSHVTVEGERSDGRALNEPYPAGATEIKWTATDDINGNVQTCTQLITVTTDTGDTTPPTFTNVPGPVSVTTNSCAQVVEESQLGTAEATDSGNNCQPGTVNISRSGVPSGNLFPTGTTTITYTATDAAGNSATATQTVTVSESPAIPPSITAPSNVSANTGPGATSCGTVVSDAILGTASASDNCPGVTVVRTGVPAGNIFPVGNTTVTYTATDRSGNSSSATQTVTVIDNTVPIVTPPAAVTLFTGPTATSCGVTVTDLNGTLGTGSATDNCPGVGAVSRTGVPSGNVFPVGTTTLTYSATDAHGNTGSATQVVTVVDNTPPVISCPASITIEPTCPSGAIATYSTPTATDNCAVQSVTRTAGPASGSVFPVGTTTVTHTATDIYGNQSSCSFTVTVLTPQAVIQNLINSVNASSLTGTQKNGLLAKLNAALTAINGGGGNACAKLSDFVNSVGTLISHGDISAAQGNAWISSANHVRNYLGCTSLPCS